MTHKATFATDKRNPGKYLIRVVGPSATRFAGRRVPVEKKNGDQEENQLLRCIWAGTTKEGQPVALYTFEATPRPKGDDTNDIPF